MGYLFTKTAAQPSRPRERPKLTAAAIEDAERRDRIAEQERYINGAADTQYKFELLLSPRAGRGRAYQIFFVSNGEVRDLLNDETAMNDLDAAIKKRRHLVFIFADARDVSVFRRRLPIFAQRGYKSNDRDGDVRPDRSPSNGGGDRVRVKPEPVGR